MEYFSMLNRRFFTGITIGLILGGPLFAQDVSHCVGIDDPDSRLNCFDDAFVETKVEQQLPQSDWSVKVDTSALDDSKTVVLSLYSKNQFSSQYGQLKRGTLIIRCQENTTSLYTLWGDHFMSDNRSGGRVDYRVDEKKASRVNMTESTDNKALGLWNGGGSIEFIKRLFGAKQLYTRATPFSESPVEMTFNITGLERAIEPLREACNW
jgi:type VI secretion system protein VasI